MRNSGIATSVKTINITLLSHWRQKYSIAMKAFLNKDRSRTAEPLSTVTAEKPKDRRKAPTPWVEK